MSATVAAELARLWPEDVLQRAVERMWLRWPDGRTIAMRRAYPVACIPTDVELCESAASIATVAQVVVESADVDPTQTRADRDALRRYQLGVARGAALMVLGLGSPAIVEMLHVADVVAAALAEFGRSLRTGGVPF